MNVEGGTLLDSELSKALKSMQAFDPSLSCYRVFKLLRNVIYQWYHDSANFSENEESVGIPPDILLSDCYRWIKSNCSTMYQFWVILLDIRIYKYLTINLIIIYG